MNSKLRWGIIGASDIAATRIIPAIRRGGDTIEFVQSSTAKWASEFAATHDIPKSLTDLNEGCASPDIDAVYISSANPSHAAQTIEAVKQGKHVLCEKPLAMNLEDGREMIEAAAQYGVVLATNHHLPGAATHRTIQRLVTSGALGTPLAVRVAHAVMLPDRLRRWRLDDPAGGGVILDITVHDISAIQAILGQPATEAAAIAVRQGEWGGEHASDVPDAVMATLRFGDVPVQVHDAFTVEHSPTSITVIGTEGSVQGLDVMSQDPAGRIWLTTGDSTEEIPVSDRPDLYDTALDAFRSAIAGRGEPSVSGVQGLTALAGALAVQESASTGRSVRVPSVGSPEA